MIYEMKNKLYLMELEDTPMENY